MINEIAPVTIEDEKIMKGRIPNFEIEDKSAAYNAEKTIQGIKIYITILFKGVMSFSDRKSIRLRTYPKPIIKIMDKIVTSISFINNNLTRFYKKLMKNKKKKK